MIKYMPAWAATYLLAFLAIFAVARYLMRPDDLIATLNGLFCGSVVALAVILRKLAWNALLGRLRYGDATVFTLGLLMVLTAVCLGVGSSIYLRATGVNVPSLTAVAFARYLVSVGFIVIAYAPDFGLGFFTGRDRRIVIGSVATGLIVAGAVILAQQFEVFA